MSVVNGPRRSSGAPSYPASLKLFIDAGNPLSYPGSGTIVNDLIGTQNGTLVGGVGYSSSNGGYFTFDGINDYIDLGNNSLIRTLDARTMSMWVKVAPTASTVLNPFFFDTEPTTSKGLYFYFDAGGYWGGLASSSSYQQVPIKNVATKDVWYYLTYAFDGTFHKGYLNGVLVATYNQTMPVVNSTVNSIIGKLDSYYHKGNISMMKIYNTYLNDAEVLTDFNEFKSRYGY